eukprot:3917824-Pyramimonas_sp.AAC.1
MRRRRAARESLWRWRCSDVMGGKPPRPVRLASHPGSPSWPQQAPPSSPRWPRQAHQVVPAGLNMPPE